jgi:16S rRNA (cytidine1402-2'-O)-methyltransferase
MTDSTGRLYLVPTPIGNLDDMTERATRILEHADLVACEDTRVSGRLFAHLGFKKKLISYHDFNESSRAAQLIARIREGATVAVISDAGSPGISDPAYRVVRAAIEAGIPITALPGPCAIIPALTASGLPTDRFFFEGFISHKNSTRMKRLEELKTFPHTLVFYDSPFRFQKSLNAMLTVFGDRRACLAREISKIYEEFIRGSISEILKKIEGRTIKGEIVLVVAGTAFTGQQVEEFIPPPDDSEESE